MIRENKWRHKVRHWLPDRQLRNWARSAQWGMAVVQLRHKDSVAQQVRDSAVVDGDRQTLTQPLPMVQLQTEQIRPMPQQSDSAVVDGDKPQSWTVER